MKTFLHNERLAFKIPEQMSTWEWLSQHYVLDRRTSAVSGKYPVDLVPYFKVVADWLDSRKIRLVEWEKSAQEGVTTFGIGWLLKRQYESPGPQMLCMAVQATVERMNETRIQPAIEAAGCFKGIKVKYKQSEVRMSNGGSMLMTWASSIAGTASDSVRDQIVDEITKPEYSLSTKEGETVDRIIQRAITFPNGKALVMSTVTIEGDKMYKRRQSAEAIHYIQIPCPACGVYQQLFFFPGKKYVDSDGIEQPGGCVVWNNDAGSNEEKAKSARYKCGHCDYLMTSSEKNKALAKFICVPDRKQDPDSPRRFISTWRILSPRSPGDLSEIVRSFLDCKDDPQKFQSFVNNCLGEYWTDRVSKPDDNLFSACRWSHEAGFIPDDAVCLTIGIDVQKRGFWYVVRAWTREETSYKIEHGYIRTEAELDELVFLKAWPTVDGRYMGIWRAGIDTGGGKRAGEAGSEETEISSTDWVCRWYLKNRMRGVQIILTKGSSKELPTLIKIGAPMMKTSDGKSIKNGLQIVSIDTNKTKDLFFWRIAETKKSEPVCPSYTSADDQEDYFDQLKAEEKRRDRKTGKTKWVQIGKDNHYLDCEQMQIALASRELFGGVMVIRNPIICSGPERSVEKKKIVKKKKPQPTNLTNPFGTDSGGGFWGGN